jgi:hypothetical protein
MRYPSCHFGRITYRAVAASSRALTLAVPLTVLTLCLSGALFAQATSESAYSATRDSAIRALTARVKQGEPFAKYMPAHDSALKNLERRLRVIIGPFQAKGFPGPGHINIDDLFPADEGFGGLDGLMYETADHTAGVVVTTRSLLATWLTQVGRGIPRDPIEALGVPDLYTFAINTESAVYRYATIPVADASRLGVVAAMLVIRAQDTGPLTPDQVIVSVVRGSRVFIVTVPAAARIAPPPACLAVRDSVIARVAGQNLPPSEDPADDAYRGCYGERVPRDPRFQTIVAQVQAIAAVLPPR